MADAIAALLASDFETGPIRQVRLPLPPGYSGYFGQIAYKRPLPRDIETGTGYSGSFNAVKAGQGKVRGSKFEVFGTSSRAFLACHALHAPGLGLDHFFEVVDRAMRASSNCT